MHSPRRQSRVGGRTVCVGHVRRLRAFVHVQREQVLRQNVTGRAHSRRRDDAGDVEDGGGGDGRNKVFLPSSDNCIYGERMVVGYVGTLRDLSLCGMPSLTLNTC